MASEAEYKTLLEQQGYLTTAAFAGYLHVSKSVFAVSYGTLRRQYDEGKLEVVKVGGQYRILKDEVERYLREGPREGSESSSLKLRLGSQSPQT